MLLLPLGGFKAIDRDLKTWLGGSQAFQHDEGFKVFEEVLQLGKPLATWPAYWGHEFLLAAGGLVLIAVLGLPRAWRERRVLAVATLLAAAPYLLFFARWGVYERGAYFTALWPWLAAMSTLRLIGQRASRTRWLALVVVLIAVQGVLGVQAIRAFARSDPYPRFVASVARTAPAPQRLYLLTGDSHRAAHVLVRLGHQTADLPLLRSQTEVSSLTFPSALAEFPTTAVQEVARRLRAGERVLLDDAGDAYLQRQWPELLAGLRTAFVFRPLPGGEFLSGQEIALR
jgi:hypothetical protein